MWRKSVYFYWRKTVHFILLFTKLVPVEKGLPKVREKLRSDLSFQEKDFSEHISPEYLAWSPALRKYTNPRTRLEVCVRLLNNPTSQDALKEKLIKELADTIEYSDKVESKIRDQIERKWFIKYKLQTSMVRPDELMEYLQNEYGDDDESNELLLRVLESNHYSQELVELVPRKKAIERIWDKLSDDVKLNYYRKHPKVERDIDELVLLLKYLPQYKKDIYMRCLGLDLISDDRLIPLLAPPEQVKQICLKSTLNNKLKNQLLLVLQENHYPKALLNQIPQKIFTEIIWEELPTAVKLDYYINNPSFERDADRLIAMLKTIPQSERLEYIESLGLDVNNDERLFSLLSPFRQIEKLCLEGEINSRSKDLLQQVLEENHYERELLGLVPMEIIINNLWDNLPDVDKLYYFFDNPNLAEDIDQFISLLDRGPYYIEKEIVKKASDAFKADNKLSLYLDQEDQFERFWMKSEEEKLKRERLDKQASFASNKSMSPAKTANKANEKYVNHCWNCKRTVTNDMKRCPSCGWFVCASCGSCGCGFKGGY